MICISNMFFWKTTHQTHRGPRLWQLGLTGLELALLGATLHIAPRLYHGTFMNFGCLNLLRSDLRSYACMYVKQIQTYSNFASLKFIWYASFASATLRTSASAASTPAGGVSTSRIRLENPTPTDSNILFLGDSIGVGFGNRNVATHFIYSYLNLFLFECIWLFFWAINWNLLSQLGKPTGADWIAINQWRWFMQ